MSSASKRECLAVAILLALALGVRLLAVALLPQDPNDVLGPLSDAGDYDLLARRLAEEDRFGTTAFRPPVYPTFLFYVYKLAGTSNLAAVGDVQAFLGAFNSFLIWLLARRIGAGMIGSLIALLAAALYPAFVFQTPQVLTEVLHRSLQLGAIVALLHGISQPSRNAWCLVAGILMALAVLTKSVLAASLPFLCLALLLIPRGASHRDRILALLTFIAPLVFIMSLWTARNHRVCREFVPVSTNFPITFAQGVTRFSFYTAKWSDPADLMVVDDGFLKLTQLRAYRYAEDEIAVGKNFAAEARAHIAERPWWFAKLTVRKALHFWSPFIRNSRPVQVIAFLSMAPVLILGWIGLITALKRRGEAGRLAFFALCIALPVTIPHALSQPDVRYRLALVDPLWITLAGWWIGGRLPHFLLVRTEPVDKNLDAPR